MKLTHDGGLAVFEDSRLCFSWEREKIDNNMRYSRLDCWNEVQDMLRRSGLRLEDMGAIVIDGWHRGTVEISTPEGRRGLSVSGYQPAAASGELLRRRAASLGGGADGEYGSYCHVAGHVLSAYCTSPFARRGEESLVLVWDGGMMPHLYSLRAAPSGHGLDQVQDLGAIHGLLGSVYPIFAMHFPPFGPAAPLPTDPDVDLRLLPISGKVMAYAGLGTVDPGLVEVFRGLLPGGVSEDDFESPYRFTRSFLRAGQATARSSADIIASFQAFLGDLLVEGLAARLESMGPRRCRRLCIAGGCALNIKWNARLRDCGLFDEEWIPPFPNDSGSAIGAVCCELARCGETLAIDWSVFAGPGLAPTPAPPGWAARRCSPEQIGELLARDGSPLVFLEGRSELGPRALGHRSILASAEDGRMKDRLNGIKEREDFRPIAPACLEEDAPDIFDPGCPDPFMLYEHQVRPGWRDRIPAVVHVDRSARLQTVPRGATSALRRVLSRYRQLTGVPVLCNTSANAPGRGFFPDAASAMRWGRSDRVWADHVLYERGR
jgi:carbamoyltransferase